MKVEFKPIAAPPFKVKRTRFPAGTVQILRLLFLKSLTALLASLKLGLLGVVTQIELVSLVARESKLMNDTKMEHFILWIGGRDVEYAQDRIFGCSLM